LFGNRGTKGLIGAFKPDEVGVGPDSGVPAKEALLGRVPAGGALGAGSGGDDDLGTDTPFIALGGMKPEPLGVDVSDDGSVDDVGGTGERR